MVSSKTAKQYILSVAKDLRAIGEYHSRSLLKLKASTNPG